MKITLNNGVEIPTLGLGTFKMPEGKVVIQSVRKAFNDETVHISGIKFAKNVTLRDFTLDYDRKSHCITTKAVDDRQEKKHEHRNFRQPEKRRKMKI